MAQRHMQITAGAAQGSVLGPVLWNSAYDGLLREAMPDETTFVGYADDVAVLVAARDIETAQLRLNQAMRSVNRWFSEHELSLALNKIEIVIITKRRIPTALPIIVGETEIIAKHAVKYLGILLDKKLNFWEQIKYTADKAAERVTSLGRLMANTTGPRPSKRRLLMSTVESILLYGAEIWVDALSKKMYRTRLEQVQRRAAIKQTSAYRTVSGLSLAKERQAIYRRKGQGIADEIIEEERSCTIIRWQEFYGRKVEGVGQRD